MFVAFIRFTEPILMKNTKTKSTTPTTGDHMVNKPTIARHYTVSTRTVDNWIKQRLVPYTKIGGVVRFRISEVDEALGRFHINN